MASRLGQGLKYWLIYLPPTKRPQTRKGIGKSCGHINISKSFLVLHIIFVELAVTEVFLFHGYISSLSVLMLQMDGIANWNLLGHQVLRTVLC